MIRCLHLNERRPHNRLRHNTIEGGGLGVALI